MSIFFFFLTVPLVHLRKSSGVFFFRTCFWMLLCTSKNDNFATLKTIFTNYAILHIKILIRQFLRKRQNSRCEANKFNCRLSERRRGIKELSDAQIIVWRLSLSYELDIWWMWPLATYSVITKLAFISNGNTTYCL